MKFEINDVCSIKVDITDENILTTCPECGAERTVDLVELIQSTAPGDFCLFSTALYCEACGEKLRKNQYNPNSKTEPPCDGRFSFAVQTHVDHNTLKRIVFYHQKLLSPLSMPIFKADRVSRKDVPSW